MAENNNFGSNSICLVDFDVIKFISHLPTSIRKQRKR